MVGAGIAPPAANSEPDMKISLHPALQRMVLISEYFSS
jgi:hypothetical protein